VVEPTPTKRPYRPAEGRLIAEFMASRFAGATILTRVKLGPYTGAVERPELAPEEQRMVGIWRRWVDAVAIKDGHVFLLEGKIKPSPGVISQLQLYLRLWPRTPEWGMYSGLPTTGLIVTAIDDPVVRSMAVEAGLEVEIFSPPWVRDYLRTLHGRSATAARGDA
jgi:hypothetical protein